MRGIEHEPLKENEIWCAYCGPGWKADWELVTDEGEMVVCDNHHFVLKEINAVGMERKIGEEEWKEVPDFNKQNFNKEKDDATINFVSRQAQEAILNPNLLKSYKDEVVDAAVGALLRIAERWHPYDSEHKQDGGLDDIQSR